MISVVLATYNEEENIRRCLESVSGFADEIIVVDGESTDATATIAKKFGAKVIVTTNKPIFHINKQMAIEAAKGDWILQLDADEVVTEKLAREVIEVINMNESQIRERKIDERKKRLFTKHQSLLEERDGKFGTKSSETVAFFVPRRNVFLGKALKYGGTYPDGVVRLIKKGKARFPEKSVHEQIAIDGKVDWLKHDLLHYTAPTFHRYLTNANRYTTLTAKHLEEQKVAIGVPSAARHIIGKPVVTFATLFIRHKGFLDGFEGFIFALFSSLHWPIAYMKYWEMRRVAEKRN